VFGMPSRMGQRPVAAVACESLVGRFCRRHEISRPSSPGPRLRARLARSGRRRVARGSPGSRLFVACRTSSDARAPRDRTVEAGDGVGLVSVPRGRWKRNCAPSRAPSRRTSCSGSAVALHAHSQVVDLEAHGRVERPRCGVASGDIEDDPGVPIRPRPGRRPSALARMDPPLLARMDPPRGAPT
jgi:hypothetical protein